ncbi:hypothetical protein EV11_0640 [Prochlorococcus sp. SS52]|uniref:Uncharacterized protein n=1 Tax=Prochlorococcus marinus (strain SARG / CCMP1375 / SS120) TaxID=167539 RepID=Q7VDD0_PROMA|nr:Predicted protein [Prochlorococcus marinus subsp. marinus str. CCMP1375]KGG11233.1 hypothetical protein EV04_1309 [Prochlorococcus marinus str. LG]KGG21571.1 hypothetical protein EV08_0660 [Prochlorococcus marinus str. SS2]KGG33794.1 hypothetical protein EV10_0231 [Prochlorococcus marinus str. SS51]KGG36856.1 hypothetical protein EV11_0640 [Prochlorococcus sp. SS52]
MKRVFGRWIIPSWASMSSQEKLQCKRFCLLPLFAYGVLIFLNKYALTLLIMLLIYFAYQYFEKKKR